MAGWPYDTGSSFVRYPSYYAHDAFGHVGADDPAEGRKACFRKIPHTGIDISPKKQGDTNAKVVSPVFGTIVASGFDKEAGNWHIIKHAWYNEWWILGHHSRFIKTQGPVDRGEDIARMGASGGVTGVHTHVSVATSWAAALDQINGYINYKNGRSTAAWAVGEGLVDPWPLIEREWADEVKRIDAVEAASAAAAIAAALAEAEEEARAAMAKAEAEARENAMKTRKIQIGGDILVSNISENLLWHVPNTRAMPVADLMVDDPKAPTIVLDAEGAKALFDAMSTAQDPQKILSLRKRVLGS